MKKTLLALAAMTAFAGAASAQSSVTLYGRIDLSVAKNIGSDAKALQNGSGSRFGVRGVEDLGGGMSIDFNLEHRYNADDGFNTPGTTGRFWHGRSVMGLKGGFGRVSFGREYTPAFLYAQLSADPWGLDTVAQLPSVLGGIAKVRQDNSVNYQIGGGGFNLWLQTAEGDGNPKRPFSAAVNYSSGPLYFGLGFENPGAANDDWMYANLNYNFGAFKLMTGFGSGNNTANAKVKQILIGGTAPMGAGEFRVAFTKLEVGNTTTSQKAALGYHYSMSKRTTVYFDVANDSKAAASKSGYDIGIKHNF